MSKSVSRTVAGADGTPDERAAEHPGRTLDVLGDEDARRILAATAVPKTVSDLVEELGMTQSTAYRKVRALEGIGLLEQTNPDADMNTPTRYRRAIAELTVRLQGDLLVEYATADE